MGDYYYSTSNKIVTEMQKKIIAIVGASATGKSTVEKELEKKGLKRCISHTSRPKRHYEEDGNQYHFSSEEIMLKMKEEGYFIEFTTFNGWHYAMSHEELKHCDIVVVEPNGLKQIIEHRGRSNVFVVYLTLPDKERLIRSLVDRNDGDVDEVIRRYMADKEDMKDMINECDVMFINRDSVKTAELIEAMIGTL